MTRVYLSGKITGLKETEYKSVFQNAEDFYKSCGFEVVNPVKIGEEVLKLNASAEYEDFLVRDLEALSTCTHIVMLEGWETSAGARREKAEAERLGLEIMYLKNVGGRK